MSQPLLFLALRSRSPSFHLNSPYLHFEGGCPGQAMFSTRFVDKHFKLSLCRHNRRRFDLLAQETVSQGTTKRVNRPMYVVLVVLLSVVDDENLHAFRLR